MVKIPSAVDEIFAIDPNDPAGNEVRAALRAERAESIVKVEQEVPWLKPFMDTFFARLKRQLKEEKSNKNKIMKKWLGTTKFRNYRQVYPFFLAGVVYKTLQKMDQTTPPEPEWNWTEDWADDPGYSHMRVTFDTKAPVLTSGYKNVTMEGKRFIFHVQYVSTGFQLTAIVPEDGDEKTTDKILGTLSRLIHKENFFKGQTLTYAEHGLHPHPPSAVGWNDVVLDVKIKEQIYANTVYFVKNAAMLAQKGIPLRRGVLLSGEPGNGKTMTAKAVAREAGVTNIWITGNSITSMGDLSNIFAWARELAPTVLVFEDIDGIGLARGYEGGGTTPLLSQLLAELDGTNTAAGVIVLATTNFAEKVDNALKNRPSRFDRHYVIKPPTKELTIRLLNFYLNKRANEVTAETVDALSAKIDGKSGAYLAELVQSAFVNAVRANRDIITNDDLISAAEELFNFSHRPPSDPMVS